MPISSTNESGGSEIKLWYLKNVFPHDVYNAYDNNPHFCEILPRSSKCRKCGKIKPDWYPKPPPTVRLYVVYEVPHIDTLNVLILHELLYDVLKPYMPYAVTTRCATSPGSPCKVGERYLSVSVPKYESTPTRHLYDRDKLCIRCDVCGAFYGGWLLDDVYVYLRPEQRERELLIAGVSNIMVRQDLKGRISALFPGFVRWFPVIERDEPLGYQRVPEDGLGPADPSPFPRKPPLPNAPRQPKKKRGGL